MSKKLISIFILIPLLLIFVVLSIYSYYFKNFTIDANVEHFAQFGDYVGGTLNPILAFFAFLALLYTIKLQSDALKISQEELSATREELEKSRIAQEEQSDSLELQNKNTRQQTLESTFFQLNSLLQQSTNNIHMEIVYNQFGLNVNNISVSHNHFITAGLPHGKHEFHGKVALEKYVSLLKEQYNSDYNMFNKEYEDYTGTYFGQIYQIIKFIDESNIENKQRYINIFRAQFTKYELEFLFYHCLGSIGKRKFQGLIEDYQFFEHLSLNNHIEVLLTEYDINAFGENEKIKAIYDELSQI